jgi:release factor glutamine methyltransferase
MTTLHTALSAARNQLMHLDTSRLDAQVLLRHVLGVDQAHLLTYPQQALTPEQVQQYTRLVQRRADGEPIAYIVGSVGFYDRDIFVTPDVLIPRPETEHLIEAALAHASEKPDLHAADIGTGSGAIAVTFAARTPGATLYATDISPAALSIAQRNAAYYGLTNITFIHCDLCDALIQQGKQLDLLMANLPYIRSDELPRLEVSKHEPTLALDGGADGLDLVRRLLGQVPQVCKAGALILLEIGAAQGQAALDLAAALHPAHLSIQTDYAGHDRLLKVIV